MAKNKKVLTVLSTAAITGLITAAVGSTAFAKTSGILLNNGSNDYKYDLTNLQNAFGENQMDSTKGVLYQDYAGKLASGSVVGLYDDTQSGKVIDYSKVSAAFAKAQLDGTAFDINAYTQTSTDYVTPTAPIYDQGVGTDGKITSTIEPAPVTSLAVSSVSANNYKEIVVTFNEAVDTTTAQNISNYVLTGDTATLAGAKAAVQADGKTVVITLAGTGAGSTKLTSQSSDALKVSGVKDTAGNVITATTTNFTPLDTTIPTVSNNVQVLGPTTLRITFSEPISNVPTVNVDNNTYSATPVATTGDDHSYDILLGSPLPAGNHTLTVSNATDYAGFSNVSTNLAFAYAKDTSALTSSVVSASQNQVVLKFNKPVPTSVQSNLSVYHTYNNVPQYKSTSLVWGTDNQTVTATFAGNYLPIGNDTVYVNAGTSPNVVADAWGNAFTSTSFNVSVTADTTAPVVTAVNYVDATHIDVTYSKPVSGASTLTNYTLKDSNGNAVSILAAVQDGTNPQIYHLTTAALVGGTDSLAISGIKDLTIAQNPLVPYANSIVIPDNSLQSLTGVTYIVSTPGATTTTKLIAKFNKQVATSGAYSALDASKYEIVDGPSDKLVSQISGATVTLGADGKSVIITLPTAINTSASVKVGQVADSNGNVSNVDISSHGLTADNITGYDIVAGSATAISSTTVQFDVDTTLSAKDVNKFLLNGSQPSSVSYVNGTGKATVTVVAATGTTLPADASGINLVINGGGLTSTLGTVNSSSIPVGTFVDKIAPAVKTVATEDADGNGELDAIKITFDEPLYQYSVTDSDFAVDGHSITGISLDPTNTIVTLTLKEAGLDATTQPKVTITGVEDAAKNPIAAGTILTPSIGVNPASVKTAAIASVISNATVTSDVAGGYDVNIPAASKTLTVQTLANDLTSAQLIKLGTSITVNNVTIDLSNGLTADAQDKIAKAIKAGATASTTTLNDASGLKISVNGVTYTIK